MNVDPLYVHGETISFYKAKRDKSDYRNVSMYELLPFIFDPFQLETAMNFRHDFKSNGLRNFVQNSSNLCASPQSS